jgi:hypothetical protein
MLLEQKLIESLGELGTVIESAFEYKTYLALLNNSANAKNLEIIVKDSGQLSSSAFPTVDTLSFEAIDGITSDFRIMVEQQAEVLATYQW